jgi:hypothetical protein
MDFSEVIVHAGFSPEWKLALIVRNRPESRPFG